VIRARGVQWKGKALCYLLLHLFEHVFGYGVHCTPCAARSALYSVRSTPRLLVRCDFVGVLHYLIDAFARLNHCLRRAALCVLRMVQRRKRGENSQSTLVFARRTVLECYADTRKARTGIH
jgi:hypothetical protein